MHKDLPEKLTPDAIVEAIVEVRFEYDDPSPEVLIGRLADATEWQKFPQRRLPTADIPATLRRADPGLRYQPALDLTSEDIPITVRIGPQSLAYSRRAPYPGWSVFGSEVKRAIAILFEKARNPNVTRLGLRYINALQSDLHGVLGFQDLNLTISVAGKPLAESVNLNFRTSVMADSLCFARLATPDLAQGNIPENTTVIVDLDVFTDDPYKTSEESAVIAWLDAAHEAEKIAFFGLLTSETIARLESNN